ncbi:sensor histidine kinase [Roseateles chitinivorans]|uniref:sensor histidine kinase n=1 Tax=Roseateles chitinivorans TaxID=2917965 RepID=UPI003D66AE11
MIKRTGDDAGRRSNMVASLERQVGQLTSLVRDMTDVSAVRSGKLSLNKIVVSMHEIVASALEACDEQLRAKNHRLEVHLSDSDPLLVHGDAVRLTQVLVNLVSNAVKYTPTGGTIEVQATRRGHHVDLCVVDSGVGIDPSDISKIFDMYMQVEMDKRPIDSGLGIGLALVKQLVEMHQGKVTVSSDGLGKGSVFRLTLPAYISGVE